MPQRLKIFLSLPFPPLSPSTLHLPFSITLPSPSPLTPSLPPLALPVSLYSRSELRPTVRDSSITLRYSTHTPRLLWTNDPSQTPLPDNTTEH